MAASLCEQYATVWPDDGSRQIASAICTAESGGNPQAHCASCAGVPEDSRGLWQINTRAWTNFDPNALFDPAYNAQAAFTVYQQQGWRAWSTYSGGKYLAALKVCGQNEGARESEFDDLLQEYGEDVIRAFCIEQPQTRG